MIQPGSTQELGQYGSPSNEPVAAPEQASDTQVAPQLGFAPDDPNLLLMIRNAIIALNQANLTGNYSVLRDMGTPNFQQSNSQARLAEAFSGLRARKIDISPVMFFKPKFTTPPAMQDGQLLRVAGAFPTTPEHVQFDLALQMLDDRWMIAAIAVNVVPPGEDAQTFAASLSTGHHTEADAKPVRIDLTQASAVAPPQVTPPQAAAPKKHVAKRPKPNPQKTATAAQPGATPSPQQPVRQAPPTQAPSAAPSNSDGGNWNPFGGGR